MALEAMLLLKFFWKRGSRFLRNNSRVIGFFIICAYAFALLSSAYSYFLRSEPNLDHILRLSSTATQSEITSALERLRHVANDDPSVVNVAVADGKESNYEIYGFVKGWKIAPMIGVDYSIRVFGSPQSHHFKVLVAHGPGVFLFLLKRQLTYVTGMIVATAVICILLALAGYLAACVLLIPRTQARRLYETHPLPLIASSIIVGLVSVLVVFTASFAMAIELGSTVDGERLHADEMSFNGIVYVRSNSAQESGDAKHEYALNYNRVSERYLQVRGLFQGSPVPTSETSSLFRPAIPSRRIKPLNR